ncbi:TPA: gamma-glutamylcyclotransferase [Burkholderia aenigmatica]|nr:gamma-glutamylcyclotransferase [Burkholderia aenigmatica]HDR9514328.1 gamma-glutamylcyclotransferase [Burkholderia aenigmatica]HDR9591718.1 gamma-glutamylcyclotransferase [Burkholderia aenigmatica]HDR9600958.1 gamma-glutamylcyclotransferase [Burkholderia aenigmatica]HDR9607567.1 gamma-glutamylcyclotransferase [Burkholderia aenigmatica]
MGGVSGGALAAAVTKARGLGVIGGGYGDLDYITAEINRVGVQTEYHRRLCIESRSYRGSEQFPGLVFGLCEGGSCAGVAYFVPEMEMDEFAKLRKRELNKDVYIEKICRSNLSLVKLCRHCVIRAISTATDIAV